ncbi:MAG: sigma-54-dependent Fis family transcriptional regulator, partial [Rhodobacterales bacterium]|nr:sigma-54-dependent Fis family transcriptional regulator [Rhodobacterales bacterium]
MVSNAPAVSSEVLIVDDEADIRFITAGILEDEGFRTRQAANAAEALSAVAARRPSLVLLDIWLQDSHLDGLGILDALRQDHPDLPVVMMSGHGTIETAVTAIRKGAYDFIEKPFQTDRLLVLVARAMEAARLKRENIELRRRTGGPVHMIGQSAAMQQVRQAVQRVAPANSRVLITGPAGSGKEVVARALHDLSRRASGPFEVLNCASMEPDRMEVELFGTESPPSPDVPRKVGTFEAADGGTLFLDEVADMPLETQGKIVRVLQDQHFERVGGGSRVQVDVRVVAASSQNLTDAIREGRFRDDLFYRLSVVP